MTLIKKNENVEELKENIKKYKIKHYKKFIKDACSIVESLDQLNMLIEVLFRVKKNKEYIKAALLSIQKTFFNICKEYTNEQLMNYLDIIPLIIYKSDNSLEEEYAINFLYELEKMKKMKNLSNI